MTIKCDFCSAPLDAKTCARFECRDFSLHVLGTRFDFNGAWAACPTCAMLALAGRWDELAERSIDTCPVMGTMPPEVVRIYITSLHREFRENRKP